MIVVDSSVLIDFLRGGSGAPVERLRRLELEEIPFAVPGICCQEVIQGARDEREWSLLVEHFEGQRVLHPRDPWSTHLNAARIFFDCRRQGITVRNTVDCFIAQLVLEDEGILLHDDEDFEHIRQVRPLRTLRA